VLLQVSNALRLTHGDDTLAFPDLRQVGAPGPNPKTLQCVPISVTALFDGWARQAFLMDFRLALPVSCRGFGKRELEVGSELGNEVAARRLETMRPAAVMAARR
jgi:hypothetical protein